MQHVAGDMFAWLHAEGGAVHGEVAVFVGAQHVVGFEALVEAVGGPDAADGGGAIQQEDAGGGVHLVVGFEGGEAGPSFLQRLVSLVYVLREGGG